MTFDRVKLFDLLRKSFAAKAGFNAVQVSVVAAVLDEWEKRGLTDVRWLAYMLATAWGECAWKPIAEIGKGKGKKYGVPVKGHVYYGRGLVQLTHHYNYVIMAKRLNLPLDVNPDLALNVPVAVQILFEGMVNGLFAQDKTGPHSLLRYFNERADDPRGARRIINGTDKRDAFARWHGIILKALQATQRKAVPAAKTVEFDAPAPKQDPATPPESAATGQPQGEAGGGQAGKAIAGGVSGGIAAGGAIAAGVDWKLVAMIAGCAVALVAIIWLVSKIRRQQ